MASFFDNQKNAGIALLVLAVVSIVMAIVSAVIEIVDGGMDNIVWGSIIAAVGTLLGGILYLGFAKRVLGNSANGKLGEKLGLNGGAINGKYDILVEFVHVFAFVSLIHGVFGVIGSFLGGSLGNGILDIIIGVVAFVCFMKLTDGKETIADKIIWIILLVIFVLTIIAGIITCIGIITIPLGICTIIIGVFMLLALLDGDVKKQFGM